MDIAHGMTWRTAATGVLAFCYCALFGTATDVYFFSSWVLWRRWPRGQELLPFLPSHTGYGLLILSTIAAIVTPLLVRIWKRFGSNHHGRSLAGPLKPLLFPCQTTHTRLFPKKHSFAYSYLMVGVPVDWEGVAGGMIATGPPDQARNGWYQVHAADYLERGGAHLGLRGKLDSYLQSQSIEPSKYPHAYLVTAAKFLGYHFNPVSFWYLYSAEKDMKAMILEVNNTFGERCMYFLHSEEPEIGSAGVTSTATTNDPFEDAAKPSASTMRRAWPKDFHVSPFNSRKGGYSLVAHDPFAPMLEGPGAISTTINLSSSKSHAKLVARVFSEGDAIDPTTMTLPQKLKFLASWWWVGFVTFPRIAKEAGMLFFKRQLHVWYRPEPLKESMGRQADNVEGQLEQTFRRYLRYLVSQTSANLTVKYTPSGITKASAETMESPSSTEAGGSEILELKVLTPVFYTRFAYYAHDLEALFCELNENCTIWISRPELLPSLVLKMPSPALNTGNPLEFGCFKLIQHLRKRPERIERPLTSSKSSAHASTTHTQTDIRSLRLSSMDSYVLRHGSPQDRNIYRSLLLKLFIADRIAAGSLELLWIEHLLLRFAFVWIFFPLP